MPGSPVSPTLGSAKRQISSSIRTTFISSSPYQATPCVQHLLGSSNARARSPQKAIPTRGERNENPQRSQRKHAKKDIARFGGYDRFVRWHHDHLGRRDHPEGRVQRR